MFSAPLSPPPYLSPHLPLCQLSFLTSDEFTASFENPHLPTVLFDSTLKPRKICAEIQFVLT